MPAEAAPGIWARLFDSDALYSFRRSSLAVGSAAVLLVMIAGALLAPWIAPQDPYDLASLNLIDSQLPPAFLPGGSAAFPLGTDNQGRDMLSSILYGTRVSLIVAAMAILFALLVGVAVGLAAGYLGGKADAVLMRIVDVQLTFPAILIALLVDGVTRAMLPTGDHERLEVAIVIVAIGIAHWPQFARTVRGSTLVQRNRDYVLAARIIGIPSLAIMVRHILPNVLAPVLVIATLNLGHAILTEATLSFLGVGLSATQSSLGTLIRIGNAFLFSGEWWITIFPGIALAAMVLSINLFGDWMRDAFNPRLR